MLIYDQVAVRVPNVDTALVHMAALGHHNWVRDTVDAKHLYLAQEIHVHSDGFKVELAFNYGLIPGTEFELLELLEGITVQAVDGYRGRMSHFGYHLQTDQCAEGPDTLLIELQKLHNMGMKTLQVSQTVRHKNTARRYRYAFVNGDLSGGIPVKVIQRMLPMKMSEIDASVAAGRELFACLATP